MSAPNTADDLLVPRSMPTSTARWLAPLMVAALLLALGMGIAQYWFGWRVLAVPAGILLFALIVRQPAWEFTCSSLPFQQPRQWRAAYFFHC